MQAFQEFFNRLGIGIWATKVMAALVGLGTLALISTWMLVRPRVSTRLRERGAPSGAPLCEQASRPCGHTLGARNSRDDVRAALPVRAGSEHRIRMLTALTIQLTVLMYIMMFAAGIRLRYSEPGTERPYRIPGGKYLGMWLVGGMGILGSMFGLILGFFPPTGIAHWSTPIYVVVMVVGIFVCSIPPFLADIFKSRVGGSLTQIRFCSTSPRNRRVTRRNRPHRYRLRTDGSQPKSRESTAIKELRLCIAR